MADKQTYRLRIRTVAGEAPGTRWIIGHRLYSLRRAHARMETLRRQGHVVHLDNAEWHDRHGTI